MERDLRDVNDRLDSLHRRVDKFYEWAAILQKEFRDMQQRLRFIEAQSPMDFSVDDLKERLDRVKRT
jgi:tetrahydromethanopterin S-methyltransferase subunit G